MRRLAWLLSLLAALVLPAGASGQSPDLRPGIAVFPFTSGGALGPQAQEDLEALGVGVQQMILTELQQNAALRVVERGSLRQLMEEQDLGASGRVDPLTAARVGKLVGARYVVTGAFVDVYGNLRLDGRIIDVETGEVIRSAAVSDKREKLYPMLVELAGRITDGVRLPPLAAGVREERSRREIPAEAIALYSRAQVFADGGRSEQAVQLYRRIVREFPQMTEAKEALRQLEET